MIYHVTYVLEHFAHFKNIFEHLIQISPRANDSLRRESREDLKPLPKLDPGKEDDMNGHLSTLQKHGINPNEQPMTPLTIVKRHKTRAQVQPQHPSRHPQSPGMPRPIRNQPAMINQPRRIQNPSEMHKQSNIPVVPRKRPPQIEQTRPQQNQKPVFYSPSPNSNQQQQIFQRQQSDSKGQKMVPQIPRR